MVVNRCPIRMDSGNWVKVSQRIPVRLSVEDTQMALRTGMSATVEVDTGVSRGLPDFFGTTTAKAAE